MRAGITAFVACILFAVPPAHAQGKANVDRTVKVEFTETGSWSIPVLIEVPVVVELDPSETITGIVRSFPEQDTWEIIKREHRAFVRAKKGAVPTALTLTTKTRTYIFDLLPQQSTPEAFSKRVARVLISLKVEPAPSPPAASSSPEAAPPENARRNSEYSLQVVSETIDVRPREVFDDGRFTYFRFPNNLQVPNIYRSAPGLQEEWLENAHREGEFIVMHSVSQLWNLRLAGTVLGIFNDAYDAEGLPTVSGTTDSSLKRQIKSAKVTN